MSISGAFDSDAVEVLPWTGEHGPIVFHYCTATRTQNSRPFSDWVALLSMGSFMTVLMFVLIFAMATHPIT